MTKNLDITVEVDGDTKEEKLLKTHENLIYANLHRSGLWARFPNHREDMVQEGRMALLKAIRTFKPEIKVKFSTYAYTLIRNAIYDYTQSMKLYQEYLIYPLFDELIDSRDDFNLDFLAMLKLIEADEQAQVLEDYFIMGMTQTEVAKVHNMKQQQVSVIITEFRQKIREIYGLE